MASRKKNSISIKRYKRIQEMNIGILIFAIVFIYLVVTIAMYATTKKVSRYEVREGSLLRDNSYAGLILREESVVDAEKSGYINYFQNESSKVKTGMNVCAVSSSKLNVDTGVEESQLNDETQSSLILKTQNFSENYDAQKFSSVYSLKNDMLNTIQNASNQTKTSQLDAVIAQSKDEVQICQSARDGIMMLTIDGDEALTADSFTDKDFDRSSYETTKLEDNLKIKSGDPMYKLVTSENWSVIIQLDKDMAKQLADTTEVKTRLDKESDTIWADLSIIKKGGKFYGRLDYDNSMIRHAQKRFLNVELILEDQSGLKIPKSSVVEKQFYVIPKEYLTTGGNSSSDGVMVKKKSDTAVFQTVDIYKTTEDGEVYLGVSELKAGTILMKPDSTETMELSQKKPLQGVYNINKGYAVFKQISILCESDEYYIIQEGDSYGLDNYDYIVQDGSTVKEEEVVF